MPFTEGQSLGRYHLLEQLGEGGMAVVFKAFDTRLERNVAIKIIRKDHFAPAMLQDVLKRFDREAKVLAQLSHPNIVKVIDFGKYEGSPYLALEYLSGGTIKERLGQPIPYAQAAGLLLPIARALAYAHQRGVVHRDIKPANILISESGDPMLTDFGIAKLLEVQGQTALTGTGVGIGTPEYMAPEQGMGNEIDGRADIYALGIVFYELVTGRRPYEADTPMAVVLKHIADPLPNPGGFVPDLPAVVTQVLVKALAKTPIDRYQDMNAYAAALEKLAQGNETPEMDSPPAPAQTAAFPQDERESPRIQPGGRSISKWTWLAGGLAVIILLMLLVWQGWSMANSQANQRATLTAEQDAIATMVAAAALQTSSPTAPATPQATRRATVTSTFTPTPSPQASATSPSPMLTDEAGVSMALIPAGAFQMGNDFGQSDEAPAHMVYLSNFYLDIFEVTNEMYTTCVQEGSCLAPAAARSATQQNYYKQAAFADYPVIYINWEMARRYCGWRSARLPTEAEWEKAARGGLEGKRFPWGDALPTCATGAERGTNFIECVFADTLPVGSFAPNLYGLYDMAGNAWEWTSSMFWPYPYKSDDGREDPVTSDFRVLRGGSWYSRLDLLAIPNRYNAAEDYSDFNVGIRCARSP